MNSLVTDSLVIGAAIHLLPITGLLGKKSLSKLYGVTELESNTEILLRHRAVLFGLLGVFLAFSAFEVSLQVLGLAGGTASTASFLVLARQVGDYNAQLSRVVVADIIALVALVVGTAAYVFRGGA